MQTGYTDDGQLLLLLTGAWQVLTGRARPAHPDAPPDELIAFWSDPAMESAPPRPRPPADTVTEPAQSAQAERS